MPDSNLKYQTSNIRRPRVAIVHDWLYGGGAERVVLELHRLYPDAPIYTSYCSDEWRARLDGKVITGYLQYPPFKQLRRFLPLLRQWWFASLDLKEFDLVISSTGNGEAKFALSRLPQVSSIKPQASDAKRPLHICYCHTPVHFYWRHYNQYVKNPSMRPKWLARLGLKLLVKPLRKRDYAAAQRVDYFIANSTHIQKDIKKFYGRDSVVIHPPVNTKYFSQISNLKPQASKSRKGFVSLGRQVPMKRFDLAIEATKQLKLPLTIIGNGPDHSRLVGMTGPLVHFKTDLTDEEVAIELANAEAFIFPSFEDFGISPVEALAAGTPVIAYRKGGALDFVIPGKTGEFFEHQTTDSLVEALGSFNSSAYKTEQVQKQAGMFSAKAFRSKLTGFVAESTGKKK